MLPPPIHVLFVIEVAPYFLSVQARLACHMAGHIDMDQSTCPAIAILADCQSQQAITAAAGRLICLRSQKTAMCQLAMRPPHA